MCQVEVRRVHGLAAQLGIEVETAIDEALILDQLHQRRHQLLRVVRELVGIPAIAWIAAIDIDRAEDAVGARDRYFMFEIQSRQGGVIDFNVDLDLLGQSITLQEGKHRRDIVVVLMLGGLEGLGLDQNGALEADAVLVLHHHRQKSAILIKFPAQVRVEQRVIAFATAPEHVVLAAEAVRHFQTASHLRGRPGIHLGIRAGGRTARVARVAEEIGGTP